MRSPARRILRSGALLALVFPLSAIAQEPPRKSEIRGVVVSADTREAMPGIQVSLEGAQLLRTTDKNGRFKFDKLIAGVYLVRAEVEGYPAATASVEVGRGERVEVEFMVGAPPAGQVLPDLEVTEADPRVSKLEAFNRRALGGSGHYITRSFIESRRPRSLADLMRVVPGVRVVCDRGSNVCALRMRRFTCGPAYFMDGMPTDPAVLWLTMPTDVEGIEVYSGPSQTPVEFEGVRSGCGVVAIWTRRGEPPPRTR